MTSMTSPGPILAATDFSAPARHAAERAAHLAHETGAPLTLMHVLPGAALQELREWLGAGHPMAQQLRDEADRHLGALVAELQTHRHVTIRPVQSTGSPLVEIGRECEDQDASLLVVGARGAGFLRQLVLGTTSERLLRRTRRPILVVRHKPHEAYRRVLVALDFSPWSAHAIALARRVAPQARLLLFNAYQVPFESKLRYAGVDAATMDHYRQQARADALQRVLSLAASSGLKAGEWAPCIVEGDASQSILEQEQEGDCDLVVLGKHGRSAVDDMLLGSVSKHVLAEGSTDVLVSTAREA
ncbi:universal stress protein [Hydrogenophaga sp.]|uniref:universal stress protein n=1 Tax=Hydrogenophaga sp. TaxID=1904254 RepID=UPI002FC96350